MAATQKAQQLIDDNAVVVFSKSYCPYCRSTKRTLDGLGAKYFAIELDQEVYKRTFTNGADCIEDGSEIQDALQRLSGQRTVPNIYIGKRHIGGNSDLEAHKNKDLKKLLKDAGALA
ncbi:glutaredoxin 3 [Sporothrix schenckii 1099-18]|uniref:Glutaredoxin 3 n=1 Tax=Sporothrix schenckii 1099-18 TaxID=1397361 RepID=A0A0F2MDD6_SPOSC|nr:glutaredoxin 3 [Sporothrix schenckii 1099-18]KJR87652.1 glutaredoxin 3 [Sporothrix schenckii 1099-18]